MNIRDYFRFNQQIKRRIEQSTQEFLRFRDQLLNYDTLISPLNSTEYRTLFDSFQMINSEQISAAKTGVKSALMVSGSNSCGKSTFIHEFLDIGKILPMGIGAVTARIVKLTYASAEEASVFIYNHVDPIDEQILEKISLAHHFNTKSPWNGIARDLLKYLQRPENIEVTSEAFIEWARSWIEIRIPSPVLELGIDIYDTPGFLSHHREEFLTDNLSIMIQRLSPTLLFLYDNCSITETDVNCFLELTKAMRVVDQSRIFFLNTKADLQPIFDDRSIKGQNLNEKEFRDLLNVVRQERYDFLRSQSVMANEQIGGLPLKADDCHSFDICSIPKSSRTPFQAYLKIMNNHCFEQIIRFVANDHMESMNDLSILLRGLVDLFFDFVRLTSYYNRPLMANNMIDEAKNWSKCLIDQLKIELTKLAKAMHDNILERFDIVNADIGKRVIHRYKTTERLSQPGLRDYLEEVLNEDVIKVAVNQTLNNASSAIRIINERLFQSIPYGRNPLVDIVRRSVFNKITALQLTKTTLIDLLTESLKKLQTQTQSQQNIRSQRMWKSVYVEYHGSRFHIVGVDDVNIFLIHEAERANFAIEYFRFIRGKLVEQRQHHDININRWIQDKVTQSNNCIDTTFHQIQTTSRERRLIEQVFIRYLADFARIQCQLIATKHLTEFKNTRPQLGEEIYRCNSYKISKIQWEDKENLTAKQPSDPNNPNFYLEAYLHHTVTQLVSEHVIVPLLYLYEHPVENNKYELWMIMPAMKQSLQQYLRENIADLQWDTANNFAIEIANGLSKLHHVNLGHRDLNSSDIFLDEENHCYLSNFRKCITGQNVSIALGTPPVVPELLETSTSSYYDPISTDVYAFGLILYELLPKDKYHRLDGRDLLISSVLYHMNIHVRWKPDLRQHEELILNCLNADPKDRPTMKTITRRLVEWKEKYYN